MKTFMFSGQGSQFFGMGRELDSPLAKEIFEIADNALGFSLTDIMFGDESRAELLNDTQYTQPALLTLSYIYTKMLENAGIVSDVNMGLSLGEYSALVASGALEFKEALVLVHKRGRFMNEAVPQGQGAMTAVMNCDRAVLDEICKKSSDEQYQVYIANYNTPAQIAIGGHTPAVEKAENMLKEQGYRKFMQLKVSGPFHTPLLESAAQKLAAELDKVKINEIKTPVVANYNARFYGAEGLGVKDTLVRQITSPVYWEDSVRYLIGQGADTFIEVGPGRTLVNFVGKIDGGVTAVGCEEKIS